MANVIKIIEGEPKVVEDSWIVVRDLDVPEASRAGHEILPFSYLRNLPEECPPVRSQAIWISPDDDFESCAHRFGQVKLIAVDFPSFRDGRGYSIGTLLRTRYGWTGELRAIGDVLRDQLNYMRRCGFDTFAVRADKDIHAALNSFSRYSVRYQGAVDDPRPLFRRRDVNDPQQA